MATSRKRSSTGFVTKPMEEETEKQELEEILEETVAETLEETEKQEEVIREITPTEDLGPRFVEEAPVVKQQPSIELKRPRPHPRNTPRFTRTVK